MAAVLLSVDVAVAAIVATQLLAGVNFHSSRRSSPPQDPVDQLLRRQPPPAPGRLDSRALVDTLEFATVKPLIDDAARTFIE